MTTTAAEPQVRGAERQARLADAVRSLRTRAADADLPRILLIAGGVLLPLGLVFIVLGWQGASHTPYAVEQTPYLISGGILGLGLVFAGGFLYFAYWLTQLVYAVRRNTSATVEALEKLEAVLSAPSAAGALSASAPSMNGTFVATASGTMFHRPDCSVVASRDGLREVTADEEGMTPCRICDPLG